MYTNHNNSQIIYSILQTTHLPGSEMKRTRSLFNVFLENGRHFDFLLFYLQM